MGDEPEAASTEVKNEPEPASKVADAATQTVASMNTASKTRSRKTSYREPGYPGALSSAGPGGGLPWKYENQQTATPAKHYKIPAGTRLINASQDEAPSKARMNHPADHPNLSAPASTTSADTARSRPPSRTATPRGSRLDDVSITKTVPPRMKNSHT